MTGSAAAAGLALGVLLLAAQPGPERLALPDGRGGIGFDDLRFSPELRAVLVPAGRTGRVDLVRAGSREVDSIEGFSRTSPTGAGHEDGPTSADAGQGYLFAIDRTAQVVAAVDARSRRVVARARLAGGPDYVRWVGAAREVWVTEPDRESIEIFALGTGAEPALTRVATIPVPGGPESLVVDATRHRAYTNTFRDATVAIDVASRRVAERWANGCRGARGIALDEARGIVFVGCSEGRAVALDVRRGGARLGAVDAGAGVDVIDFSARLSHLYVPASREATLTVVAVDARGALRALGKVETAPGAHCVAADDGGNVFVCDPRAGALLVLPDPYPSSR